MLHCAADVDVGNSQFVQRLASNILVISPVRTVCDITIARDVCFVRLACSHFVLRCVVCSALRVVCCVLAWCVLCVSSHLPCREPSGIAGAGVVVALPVGRAGLLVVRRALRCEYQRHCECARVCVAIVNTSGVARGRALSPR